MNGVMFGDKHSYRDWGLILKSRPVISPPKPKTVYVNLPEADGQIDLSESLTGDIAYGTRTISCEFNVIDARSRWSTLYSDIMDYLHGRRMQVIFDEDPVYYYEGRFQVDSWKSDKRTSTIAISGTVDPYKLEKVSSLDNWLWDPFCFETDNARDWKGFVVDGLLSVPIVGSRRPVVPEFIVRNTSGKMALIWGDEVYLLPTGTTRIPTLTIREGTHTLIFEGSGTVSISYRGGWF